MSSCSMKGWLRYMSSSSSSTCSRPNRCRSIRKNCPILSWRFPISTALDAVLAAKTFKEFPPQTFAFTKNKPVRVQPLLTPDNYVEKALVLIRSAKKTIWFQNQYIKLSTNTAAEFKQIVTELRKKQNSNVDVKIILRNEGDVRTMLEALKYMGFDMKKV